ncbi:hypothetical protein [Paenibacillus rhizophilus]|uniref:Uncharacterized protein n=1 Tax=Paenibacillus rhizophilus TaxID=1850366 RepID=A0A3N9P3M2_9BACL|nr:hypothetical protein [Paenibacillus rhizophilus]RQW10037.1 hypothetical protein EH198_16515 [Paenibacillus rhizophilus]
MVDVKELGDLLKLPNLEESTIALINEKMRVLIGEVKPLTPAQKQDIESVVAEWLGGPKEGE